MALTTRQPMHPSKNTSLGHLGMARSTEKVVPSHDDCRAEDS